MHRASASAGAQTNKSTNSIAWQDWTLLVAPCGNSKQLGNLINWYCVSLACYRWWDRYPHSPKTHFLWIQESCSSHFMQPCLMKTYCHVAMTSNFNVTLMSNCQMKKQDITYFQRSSVAHTIEAHKQSCGKVPWSQSIKKEQIKMPKPRNQTRDL